MNEIKKEIFQLIQKYFTQKKQEIFIPGKTKIGVGSPCYYHEEICSALDSLLELQLSQGIKTERFENDFSGYVGTKYGVAVNSGSSANLLATAVLLQSGRIKKGSEVIVPATTFTTVVSPLLQHKLVPVFVDVDQKTYNISPEKIEEAINKNTGFILPVHSLGCPADMEKIMKIAQKYSIPVMEDCCEAHGAMVKKQKVGSFGLLSTYSFFVAHNMTTGEGGMVLTNDAELDQILRSLREFGRLKRKTRDALRFNYSDHFLHEYDERYVFERIGYNVRMTDVHASLGIEQLKKLDLLNKKRLEIANYYTSRLEKYSLYLQLPNIPKGYFHSFYAYPLLIKERSPFSRTQLVRFLEQHQIETRAFMGGNLAVQPCYRHEKIKISGKLENTMKIMNNAFFIGCHPYIDNIQQEYVISVFEKFFKNIK